MNGLQIAALDALDRFLIAFEHLDEPTMFILGLRFCHMAERAKGIK